MVNLPTGTARRKRLVGELDNPIENIRKNKYDDINKGKVQTIHGGWQGGRSIFPDYPQQGCPSVEH